MTAQSATLLASANTFLTEVHAAALIVAVAALSWATATSRRPVDAALLGLALAALVLTKNSICLPVDSDCVDVCRSGLVTAAR